jgi:iron complex outermembrane receptor protein
MRNHAVKLGLLVSAAATALFASGAALAQEEADRSGGLEEIVVTAQRREQSMQDVPVAITAFTRDALQANRISSVSDLTGLAPGTTVRTSAGGIQTPLITIRGQVSVGVVAGADKQVSMYIDGVYISNPRGSIFDLPDIERIEVLRGPQGTLFGRNATAGAINVTTRDPTGEAHIKGAFTYGNYDQVRAQVSADTPQFGPFSAYLSFVHRYKRGDVRNASSGLIWDRTLSPSRYGKVTKSVDYLGTIDSNSYFAALKFEPSDSFKMVYKYDRNEDNGSPDAAAFNGYDPATPLTGSVVTALLNSQPNPVYIASDGLRPEVVNNGFAIPREALIQGHSVTATWQATDNLTIKNIFAYRSGRLFSTSALDGISNLTFTQAAVQPLATLLAFSRFPAAQAPGEIPGLIASLTPQVGGRFLLVTSGAASDNKQWSDELQINFHTNRLQLTAGAMWFHSKEHSGSPLGFASNPTSLSGIIYPASGLFPLFPSQGQFTNSGTSLAAYLQAEYQVTPQLSVVAGGRITQDKKSSIFEFGPLNSLTTIVPPIYKKTKPNWMVGVNYKPNDNLLLYGKYSTSFVSGGSTVGVVYEPETAKSFEVGVKADLLDRRLRANLALFHVTYEHYQSAQGTSQGQSRALLIEAATPLYGAAIATTLASAFSTFNFDAGTLRAQGFELDLTAAPARGLTMGGTLGYTDAKYTELNPLVLATNNGQFNTINRPKWTGTLWGQYESAPLFGAATFMIRADAAYKSRELLASFQRPPSSSLAFLNTVKPYWLINGRAALRHINLGGGEAELAVWGKNLTDRRFPSFTLVQGFVSGSGYIPARTYGIDVSIEF